MNSARTSAKAPSTTMPSSLKGSSTSQIDRIEHQRHHSQGPAQRQQHEPEQKFQHALSIRAMGADSRPTFGMPSILIVEDEVAIADTLQFALQGEGFGARRVSLAHEALAALRGGGIDLVILDVGLPDMSGFEVLQGAAAVLRGAGDVPDGTSRGSRSRGGPRDRSRRLRGEALLAAGGRGAGARHPQAHRRGRRAPDRASSRWTWRGLPSATGARH